MYRYQFKPETYKERAEQFLKVGKRQRALETLYDAIKNSRKQKQWSQAFEDTMSLYVRLCVELRDSQMAKDGLHQFRNVSTNTSPQSLEKIVRLYLSLSAKKCEEAKQEADRQAVEDEVEAVDDLETTETPEMLLSQVHHEDRQGRQNRVTLQPWLRFQWEAYRSCIDLLKAHNKYEAMYHDIALKAFEFVLAYDRRNEFRRLCETLRGHYEQWKMKRETPGTGVDINNQETIELNLRTRLQQLKVAIKMQLWQEAYRAIDDINTFLAELKIRQGATREFRQKFTHRLSEFYENCAYVFKKAQVHIFHAAALNRRFAMQRTTAQKELADPENNSKVLSEISKLASQLVIASLAVPLQPETEEIDQHLLYDDAKQRKMREMSRLLQLKFLPTRNLLLQELTRNGALEYALPEVQKLYHYMENEFDPQHTCTNIDAVFASLDAGDTREMFQEYLPQLRDVTVSIMLHELSQVYESIKIESVVALVPWAAREDVERVAITAAADTELNVHIDHSGSGYFVFGSDITMASTSAPHVSGGSFGHLAATNAGGTAANIGGAGGAASYMGKEDRLSNHLVSVYYNLTATVNALDLISQDVLNNALRATGERQLKLFKEREAQTQKDVVQRKELIKQRYAELEENDKRAQQQKDVVAKETREQKQQRDQERLKKERDAVEAQKAQQQAEERERAIATVRIENIRKLAESRPDLKDQLADMTTLEELDKFEAGRRQQMELEAQAKDAKILVAEKRNDHLMRALYIEEAKLRGDDDVKWQEQRAVHWQEQESKRIEQTLQLREMAGTRRTRLLRMKKFKDEFSNEIKQRLQDDYKTRLDAWNAEYEQELEKRLKLRKEERKRMKQEEFERKQQEARDRRNEELARQRQEEERIAREAETAKLRERKEAERRADEEKMKKQREREEEALRKQQEREGANRPSGYGGRPNMGVDSRTPRNDAPVAGGRDAMFGTSVPGAAAAAAADARPSEGRRPLVLTGAPRREPAAGAGPTISRDAFGTSQHAPQSQPNDRQRDDRRDPRYSQPDINTDGAQQQRPRVQLDRPRAAPAGPEFNRDQMGNAPPPSRDRPPQRDPRDQGRQPYRNDGPRQGDSTQFSRNMMGTNLGKEANGGVHQGDERPRVQLQRREPPLSGGDSVRQPARNERENRPPQQRATEGGWR